MPITLRQLQYLESTIRKGSIAAAAEELHVAQSAISVAIKQLEAEVGEALLIRQPRGMVPTRAGEFVLSETQQINRHVSRLNKLAGQLPNKLNGRVSVGISSGALGVLPASLGSFQALHPDVMVSINNREWPEVETHLLEGKLDFAITARTSGSSDRLDIHSTQIFARTLWVSGLNPFSDRETVTLDQLRDQRVLVYKNDVLLPEMRAYIGAVADAGARIEQIDTTEAIRQLVQANVGLAILSVLSYSENGMREKNVFSRPIRPEPPPFILSGYFVKGTDISEAAKALFTHLMATPLGEVGS